MLKHSRDKTSTEREEVTEISMYVLQRYLWRDRAADTRPQPQQPGGAVEERPGGRAGGTITQSHARF